MTGINAKRFNHGVTRQMRVRHWVLASAAGAMLTATAVPAEVYIISGERAGYQTERVSPDDQRWQGDGRLVVRATGKGGLSNYVGFGEDIALEEAIDMIKPPGWVTHFEAGVETDQTVSWEVADGLWPDALYEIMKDAGHAATVETEAQRLRIHPLRDEPAPVPSPTVAEGEADKKSDAAPGEHDHDPTPAQVSPTESTDSALRLSLTPGDSLRDQLQAFSESADWQFHWDVETDYTVGFEAEVDGSYREIIEQVVGAINERAPEAFTATVYANRVVRIGNQ